MRSTSPIIKEVKIRPNQEILIVSSNTLKTINPSVVAVKPTTPWVYGKASFFKATVSIR